MITKNKYVRELQVGVKRGASKANVVVIASNFCFKKGRWLFNDSADQAKTIVCSGARSRNNVILVPVSVKAVRLALDGSQNRIA